MYFNKIIMTLKYGELTIIYNNNVQTVVNTFFSWLNNEELKKELPKYIFLFDDGEICDAEDKLLDFHFNFLKGFMSVLPVYFEKTIKKEKYLQIYFENKIKCSNQLFTNYPKYKSDMTIISKYNCIYDCCRSLNPEIFGLIRIKSTEQMPRYQFAYDSDEFTKEEIIYLIHYIFNL